MADKTRDFYDIVLTRGPGPEECDFEDVEDSTGHSVRLGEWIERPDGKWALRIPRVEVEEILTALHDSEINGEVSWFYDGMWHVKLGDPLNGIDAQATVGSLGEAAAWLRENAIRLYPDSNFAKRYARGFV